MSRRYADPEPVLIEAHRNLVAGHGAKNQWAMAAARDLVTLYQTWGKPAHAKQYLVADSK